jgi:hypothetical protein
LRSPPSPRFHILKALRAGAFRSRSACAESVHRVLVGTSIANSRIGE